MRIFTEKRAAACALVFVLAGCAGPNQIARGAPRVSFATLVRGGDASDLQRMSKLPFVLHFAAGQEVPIDFAVDSRLFDLEGQGWKLRVKRDFYVLFREGGPPLLSEDGVDFEERHQNSFLVGVKLEKGQSPKIVVRLGIRAEQPTPQ